MRRTRIGGLRNTIKPTLQRRFGSNDVLATIRALDCGRVSKHMGWVLQGSHENRVVPALGAIHAGTVRANKHGNLAS